MNKRFFIFFFILGFVFIPKMVFAETVSGTASVGRQSILDTSNNYYYTDWKLLSTDSLNSIPVGSIYSGNDFYLMGSEYSFPISLTGQTNFAVTVRIPVSANTIYTYQETDGLSQSDFRVGISPNFAVYNITPTITSFNRAKGVYARNGVAHVYMYYDVVFNFTLSDPLTGAYNLNFSVMNLNANRSAYYLSGGNSGVALEFPVGYFSGQTEPDAVLFSMMSPSVSMSYGTTADNQDIIDANNENTELIISNQNENTQDIIDSIDENYQNLVNSQQVCSITSYTIDYNNRDSFTKGYLISDGSIVYPSSSWRVSDYLPINPNNSYSIIGYINSSVASFCFYDSNKSLISCSPYGNVSSINVSSSDSSVAFIRFSADTYNSSYSTTFSGNLCQNGNQALVDSITDSSVDGSIAGQFATNKFIFFNDDSLSGVITAPLNFLRSLTNTCHPVVLNVLGQDVSLPCGTTIFWERSDVSTFRIFWNTLFGGLIIYRLTLMLFKTVNDSVDPTKDKVGGLTV